MSNNRREFLDQYAKENDWFIEEEVAQQPGVMFKSSRHKRMYENLLEKMGNQDVYHRVVAYLLALDENICDSPSRVADCFDFENDLVKTKVLEKPWVTGFDGRVLTLMCNLWNGNKVADVSEIFGYGDSDRKYLLEAIRLRFDVED